MHNMWMLKGVMITWDVVSTTIPVWWCNNGAWEVCLFHFGMCCIQTLVELKQTIWQLICRKIHLP